MDVAFGVLYVYLLLLNSGGQRRKWAREWIQAGGREFGGWVWTCEELGLDPAMASAILLSRKSGSLSNFIDAFLAEKNFLSNN